MAHSTTETCSRSKRRFDVGCRIEVEHSHEHLHAHVELDGDLPLYPGDRVKVHGAPVIVEFGAQAVFHRTATVTRANALQRAWTKFKAQFELTELYEVSFSPGRPQ